MTWWLWLLVFAAIIVVGVPLGLMQWRWVRRERRRAVAESCPNYRPACDGTTTITSEHLNRYRSFKQHGGHRQETWNSIAAGIGATTDMGALDAALNAD